MRNFFVKFLIVLFLIEILLFPANTYVLGATSSSTDCNKISNPTLKKQCLVNKAKAEAAAASAAATAKQAEQVKSQINSINDNISALNGAINKTAQQISETQATINELEEKIKQAGEEIAAKKARLGQLVASWYMQGDSGLLESVLGSDSISEIVDIQEQHDSIKEQINADVEKITADQLALREQKSKQLESKKTLDDLQASQKANKASETTQQQRKTNLLNMTLAQQKEYLSRVEAAKKEINNISVADAEWRAAQARKSGATTTTGGSGGYPYASSAPCTNNGCPMDDWLFAVRQCTSYAAWYWNSHGNPWYNTQPGRGSAKYWPEMVSANNQQYGRSYKTGSEPRVGAIISWSSVYTSRGIDSTYGHVAIVDGVNSDGTINISQYNYSVPSGFDRMSNLNPSTIGPGYTYIYPN